MLHISLFMFLSIVTCDRCSTLVITDAFISVTLADHFQMMLIDDLLFAYVVCIFCLISCQLASHVVLQL